MACLKLSLKIINVFLVVICICIISACNSDSNPKGVNNKTNSGLLNSSQISKYQYYRVERVVDGDTIIVDIGKQAERIRLIGINTPESVKPGSKVERYGKEASSFTKSVLKNKKVRIELDVEKRDKYARLLAYVYLPDGSMLNKILLEEGYAQTMTIPPNDKYAKEFLAIEQKARNQKKGLWKEY